MKIKSFIYFIVGVSALDVGCAQSTTIVIAPSLKRAASVQLAEQLVKPSTLEESQISEEVRNPFDPSADIKVEIKSGRPGSDKELLELLAEQIRPTGVMGRDDSLILLSKGQKGVKVHDKLTLFFDGTAFEVELSAIDRNNFSLRYNQAQITRPIKPGKNP